MNQRKKIPVRKWMTQRKNCGLRKEKKLKGKRKKTARKEQEEVETTEEVEVQEEEDEDEKVLVQNPNFFDNKYPNRMDIFDDVEVIQDTTHLSRMAKILKPRIEGMVEINYGKRCNAVQYKQKTYLNMFQQPYRTSVSKLLGSNPTLHDILLLSEYLTDMETQYWMHLVKTGTSLPGTFCIKESSENTTSWETISGEIPIRARCGSCLVEENEGVTSESDKGRKN